MKKVVVYLIRDDRKRVSLRRQQLWRWNAKGANGEVLASGEKYFNRQDAVDVIRLLFGDDVQVTLRDANPDFIESLREPRPF